MVSTRWTHSNTTVYNIGYHIIWCSKYRWKVLTNYIEIRLKELLLSKAFELGLVIEKMEVMPDHVHLLLDVDPKIGIYSVVTKIKGYTSKQLREEFPAVKKRIPTLWTHSKFISSVGSVTLDVVKRYIDEQKHV